MTDKKPYIMFVDDERQIRELFEEYMENAGIVVETYSEPHGALEAFQQDPQKYDLIIADYKFPKMDGLSFLQKIKDTRSDIKLILVSGFHEKINAFESQALGIDACFTKPFSMKMMLQKIKELVNHS